MQCIPYFHLVIGFAWTKHSMIEGHGPIMAMNIAQGKIKEQCCTVSQC